MLIQRSLPRSYAFVSAGAAGRFVDAFHTAITADGPASAALCHPQAQILSDLKARVKSNGHPQIKSAYWSVRCPDPDIWGGLRGRTLVATPDRLVWHDLPQDPALVPLADLQAQPGDWLMLRHIPLRRATLLHRPPNDRARIVKVKRPDRALDAANRLAAVQAAVAGHGDFAVPDLLAVDPAGTFTQSICPGCPITPGIAPPTPALLRRIGRLLGQLHLCPADGLPAQAPPVAADTIAIVAALHPALAEALPPIGPTLANPPPPTAQVLCHGDFGFDQILQDGQRLSLVDFDRAHRGEAAADIARFLVLLAERPLRSLPPQAAECAFLGGYAECRPLPAPAPLAWFLAQAALERLHVLLRKDAARPHITARLIALIQGAACP